MVAIGGSSLIFALLSFIAAYQAGECGYDGLALLYLIIGCEGLYGADKCFDGAMNISTAKKNSDYKNTTAVDDSLIGNVNRNGKETIISTLGNEIDITPSSKYSSVNKNPGPYGEPNTSVDILDANGKLKTRRWYDSDGKAYRDVDFSNHGNPKEHPEVPHEHIWGYNNGKPKRN